MDFEIRWTEDARVSFESAFDYLATEAPVAAERMRINILKTVSNLGQFPHMGAIYERDVSGRIREIFCEPYRIFYRVYSNQARVDVLLIRHGSMDEPLLANLLDPNSKP